MNKFFFLASVLCSLFTGGSGARAGQLENASIGVKERDFPVPFHLSSACEARSHIALALFPDLISK